MEKEIEKYIEFYQMRGSLEPCLRLVENSPYLLLYYKHCKNSLYNLYYYLKNENRRFNND